MVEAYDVNPDTPLIIYKGGGRGIFSAGTEQMIFVSPRVVQNMKHPNCSST
ncbi:hypothetical protein YC2023_027475 [Brassica napus]